MGDPRDGEADAFGREGTGAAAVRDGRPRLRPGTVPGREDELRQAGGGAPGDRGSRERGRRLMPPEPAELVLGGQAAIVAIGYRALQSSADEAMEDAEGASAAAKGTGEGATSGGLAMAGAMAMALLLGVGLFFLLPLYATHLLAGLVPALRGSIAFNLADGAIRVLVFVLYIVGITRMKDIRRGFEYHGAEHKVINAYEAKADLTPEAVREYPRLHPRCGTSFLLFVMVISILVFSLIPRESSLLTKALLRLPLIPAIAGISYEVLRLSAKKTRSPWFRALGAPGRWRRRLA